MDIDAALNELGMLSSVTESRRQYVIECRRKHGRERKMSEPPANIQPVTAPRTTFTPKNSPTKTGFHILHINPTFVTNLVTLSPSKKDVRTKVDRDTFTDMTQDQENIESVSRRAKHVRQAKRFRKPYEIPWLTRRSRDVYGMPPDTRRSGGDCRAAGSPGEVSKVGAASVGRHHVGDETNTVTSYFRADEQACSVSCDKKGEVITVPRSKSLDELDFAKLRVAEQENQNYLLERREIETVSQHLQNLNVSE